MLSDHFNALGSCHWSVVGFTISMTCELFSTLYSLRINILRSLNCWRTSLILIVLTLTWPVRPRRVWTGPWSSDNIGAYQGSVPLLLPERALISLLDNDLPATPHMSHLAKLYISVLLFEYSKSWNCDSPHYLIKAWWLPHIYTDCGPDWLNHVM